jgi:hypothetical protein
VIPRLELVEAWLDEHEREYTGLTPMQEEYRKAPGHDPARARGPDRGLCVR